MEVSNKTKITLSFFKEDNKWYADVKGHTKEENEMVMGTETLLDFVSNGKTNISLQLTTEPLCELEILNLTLLREEYDGATYEVSLHDNVLPNEVWICSVTKDVFNNEFPKNIYVYEHKSKWEHDKLQTIGYTGEVNPLTIREYLRNEWNVIIEVLYSNTGRFYYGRYCDIDDDGHWHGGCREGEYKTYLEALEKCIEYYLDNTPSWRFDEKVKKKK